MKSFWIQNHVYFDFLVKFFPFRFIKCKLEKCCYWWIKKILQCFLCFNIQIWSNLLIISINQNKKLNLKRKCETKKGQKTPLTMKHSETLITWYLCCDSIAFVITCNDYDGGTWEMCNTYVPSFYDCNMLIQHKHNIHYRILLIVQYYVGFNDCNNMLIYIIRRIIPFFTIL